MTDEEGRVVILKAIAAVRDAVGTVEKDGTNPHFKYRYVSERGMQAAIRPLLKEHGLVILPSAEANQKPTIDDRGVITFVASYTLAHTSGAIWPSPLRVVANGCDRDSKGNWGDKGAWKANTGAFKYLLSRLFMLDTGDDPEKDAHTGAGKPKEHEERRPSSQEYEQAPPEDNGYRLDKKEAKRVYAKGFKASEEVYGKDPSKKFWSIDHSCKRLGFTKLDHVPLNRLEELLALIESYPQWYNEHGGIRDDDIGY